MSRSNRRDLHILRLAAETNPQREVGMTHSDTVTDSDVSRRPQVEAHAQWLNDRLDSDLMTVDHSPERSRRSSGRARLPESVPVRPLQPALRASPRAMRQYWPSLCTRS